MDDKELEAIVQQMIDAGEPEESIAAVIQGYQPQAPTQAAFTPNPGPDAPDGAVPGALMATGAALRAAGQAAPAVMHRVGQAMSSGSGRVTRAVAGAIGASTGAGLGAGLGGGVIGAFGGAGLGADAGRTIARKILVPGQKAAGKALKFVSESGFPEAIYQGQGSKTLARKAVQFGARRAIPGIGNALAAADVAKMLYDRVKGIPGAIRENSNMLVADSSYQTPEDEELLRLLAERGQ